MGANNVDNVIFGIHPIEEALRTGQAFERLSISRGRKGKAIADMLSLAESRGIEVRFETWERLNMLAGGLVSHQGVVGTTTTYTYADFETVLEQARQQNDSPFFLLLDHIQDPHNFGAILRSAECAGVQGVIFPKDHSVHVTSTVVKVSAGATAHLPICRVTNLASTIDTLKHAGIWVIGTATHAGQAYDRVDLTMPAALVIGNEEKGIRRLVLEKCDVVVSIPTYGKIASLNASVSSAILMFEVRRQRRGISSQK